VSRISRPLRKSERFKKLIVLPLKIESRISSPGNANVLRIIDAPSRILLRNDAIPPQCDQQFHRENPSRPFFIGELDRIVTP
jgi:hypothetical protein